MYVPRHFKNDNTEEVKDFIEQNGFGILVSQNDGRLWGTHIPLLFSEDRTKLYGHVSKANPQWKNFVSGHEVMVIFSGPHAYVSSSWYDHENVPTWNYIAAHVYGEIQIVEGETLKHSLSRLVTKYEKHSERPVSVETMTPDYFQRSLQGLVGFEIRITEIKAAYKLSQNRDESNYQNIVRELDKRGDENSFRVAEEMKKKWPNLF
jgi:transcriptional regulator